MSSFLIFQQSEEIYPKLIKYLYERGKRKYSSFWHVLHVYVCIYVLCVLYVCMYVYMYVCMYVCTSLISGKFRRACFATSLREMRTNRLHYRCAIWHERAKRTRISTDFYCYLIRTQCCANNNTIIQAFEGRPCAVRVRILVYTFWLLFVQILLIFSGGLLCVSINLCTLYR